MTDEGDSKVGKPKIFLEVEKVIDLCEKVLQKDPSNLEVLYKLGKCYLEARRYKSAQKIIERLTKEKKEHVYLYILNGHMLLKSGYLVESYRTFKKAYSMIQDSDFFLAYGIALLYEFIDDHKTAREWFMYLLKQDLELFKYLEVTYRIGNCYKKDDKLIDACEIYKSLLELSKTENFVHDVKLQLAHIYERMNKMQKSAKLLDEMLYTFTQKTLTYRVYAWFYFKSGEFEKLKELETNEQCQDPYIYYLIGRAHLLSNDYQKGIPLLDLSIRFDHNMFLAYNTLGVFYYKNKNVEKAYSFFLQASTIKPRFVEADNNLKMIEKVGRKYSSTLDIRESIPDLMDTHYFDSRVIFSENIHYASASDLEEIKPMSVSKMESL